MTKGTHRGLAKRLALAYCGGLAANCYCKTYKSYQVGGLQGHGTNRYPTTYLIGLYVHHHVAQENSP